MEGAEAPVAAPSKASSLSVIKHLASCNNTTRGKALRLLSKWLPSQPQLSEDDMKKIWKGLFYCVWHADKAPVQSDLINRLSSLLLTLDLPLSIDYFSVFLLTLRREWSGIDSLRLDKFYLLIRCFIRSLFLLLKKNGWDSELTDRLMGILDENTFSADDKKFLGNGVNYHIASVFLEELKPFLPVRGETLEIMFKPFLLVMSKSQDKVLLGKIKCNVFDILLKMGENLFQQRKNSVDDVGDDEIVNYDTIALTMGFAAKFYELGSSPDCFQGNRKVLFGLHAEFLKLEKDLEASGIEISIPSIKLEDDDEVPELVPIVTNGAQEIASNLLVEAPESVLEECVKKFSKKKNKKKGKEGSDHGSDRKLKMKNENYNGNVVLANGESLSSGPTSDGSNITFSEYFKSNLQMEFEKAAEEEGLDKDGNTSLCDSPKISPKITLKRGTISKKRRRARSVDGRESQTPDLNGHGSSAAKSGEKSTKKVRFSIKNNLVWKPQSPLPPQSVRIPPSVTPRGSALKKGVPPGPIREMPPATKRVKQRKKGRKLLKTASPAIKRLRKLQNHSI